MAWSEHLGGNKYKLVTRDPSKVHRPKRSITVEVPTNIAKSAQKTERWLAVELDKWENVVKSGQAVEKKRRLKSEKISFEEFIPVWEKGYANQNLGEYTLKTYKDFIKQRLIPVFGSMLIDKITTLQIVEFIAELKTKKGKDMATNTKLNIYKAMKSILDCAYDWGVIKANPIEGVKRPSVSKKEKKAMKSVKQKYTWEEVETLMSALYELPSRWRLYFTGVLLGGFRRGEFLAVEWPDLDHDRCAIYVEKQITLDKEGKVIESEVKTEESEDWVPMPKWYMDDLSRYRREWTKEKMRCPKWQGGDKQYIFHRGNGLPYYPSTATGTWSKFLRKNNLPHIKLHGLRHTAGTLLREFGADLQTVQEFLRHVKLETTKRYSHKSESVNRQAISHLDLLDPNKRKSIAP